MQGQWTPVIPPYPSPNGGVNPLSPPVIPSSHSSPNNPPMTPAWAQQPGQFPGSSPYLQPHGMQYVSMAAPGSYFIPPVALPAGQNTPAAPPNAGLSSDWTGFPQYASSGGGMPHAPSAASHPQTPYVPVGAQTMYAGFQPLPPGFGGLPPGFGGQPAGFGGQPMWGGMPMAMAGAPYATPFIMHPAMPGPMPGAFPMTPANAGGGLPHGAAPPMNRSRSTPAERRPYKENSNWDKIEKFAEGPDYGPVLKPLLAHKLKAKLQLNPLLTPPDDNLEHDYLKWNMLYPTGQCQRSSDPPHRSWAHGRHAPATWPRVSALRIVSRSLLWTVDVPASDLQVGVTCGDVLEALHAFMYTRVSQAQFDSSPPDHKVLLSQSYHHNRSTAYGVPGGRLPQTLLRCDWLERDTMFGGLVEDERCVKDRCGMVFPCTFVLKCMERYRMTEEEIEEQEAREAQAEERARKRSRSRANSRRTSRAGSRAASRPPPEESDDQ